MQCPPPACRQRRYRRRRWLELLQRPDAGRGRDGGAQERAAFAAGGLAVAVGVGRGRAVARPQQRCWAWLHRAAHALQLVLVLLQASHAQDSVAKGVRAVLPHRVPPAARGELAAHTVTWLLHDALPAAAAKEFMEQQQCMRHGATSCADAHASGNQAANPQQQCTYRCGGEGLDATQSAERGLE